MAQVVATPASIAKAMEWDSSQDYKTNDSRMQGAMRKLEEASDNRKAGEVVGGLLYFPRADGHAIYCVVSEKPLKLFHVPYGDAWTADPATIRGLRLADVQARLS